MKEKIPVSVIVMTKNEERNIQKCLHSVKKFNEVFVVDSASEDKTCELAAEMGAIVVPFDWNGKYPKKKQWCLENLPFSNDWVLYVDADEEVYPELADEIGDVINKNKKYSGFFVGSDYVFSGRVLHHGHRIYKLVLFNKNNGRFIDYDDLDIANMWEVEGHYQPKIDGKTTILKNRIRHDDHNSLFDYFHKHNRYSDWEAELRKRDALVSDEETQPGIRKFLKKIFQKLPFKGAIAFIHSYILHLGFLDGRAGFDFAMARAFYYWQIELKIRELSSK